MLPKFFTRIYGSFHTHLGVGKGSKFILSSSIPEMFLALICLDLLMNVWLVIFRRGGSVQSFCKNLWEKVSKFILSSSISEMYLVLFGTLDELCGCLY